MGESITHIRLVEQILLWAASEFANCQNLCVLRDLPDVKKGDKPPSIGGFYPDVLIEDTPTTFTLIGEAKTADDLETEHSKRQFRAYLTYLKLCACPHLVISTPWFAANSAKSLISAARRDVEANSVTFRILQC